MHALRERRIIRRVAIVVCRLVVAFLHAIAKLFWAGERLTLARCTERTRSVVRQCFEREDREFPRVFDGKNNRFPSDVESDIQKSLQKLRFNETILKNF